MSQAGRHGGNGASSGEYVVQLEPVSDDELLNHSNPLLLHPFGVSLACFLSNVKNIAYFGHSVPPVQLFCFVLDNLAKDFIIFLKVLMLPTHDLSKYPAYSFHFTH